VRNLTEQAIARHHAPACWTITPAIVKEIRGKAAIRRTKATLDDGELLYLMKGIERRNPGRANVLRTLALFGLRPIELQHLTPKRDDHGTLRIWCRYRKSLAGSSRNPVG
jgi:hypothetical protein